MDQKQRTVDGGIPAPINTKKYLPFKLRSRFYAWKSSDFWTPPPHRYMSLCLRMSCFKIQEILKINNFQGICRDHSFWHPLMAVVMFVMKDINKSKVIWRSEPGRSCSSCSQIQDPGRRPQTSQLLKVRWLEKKKKHHFKPKKRWFSQSWAWRLQEKMLYKSIESSSSQRLP